MDPVRLILIRRLIGKLHGRLILHQRNIAVLRQQHIILGTSQSGQRRILIQTDAKRRLRLKPRGIPPKFYFPKISSILQYSIFIYKIKNTFFLMFFSFFQTLKIS